MGWSDPVTQRPGDVKKDRTAWLTHTSDGSCGTSCSTSVGVATTTTLLDVLGYSCMAEGVRGTLRSIEVGVTGLNAIGREGGESGSRG